MSDAEFDNQRFMDFLTVMRRKSKANLTDEGFDPGLPIELMAGMNILVVGAGGIGCELLHALAISPLMYCNFFVVDLDTIDLSNLNRQFLFRMEHVGQPKAEVAAQEIKKKFPHMKITAFKEMVQDQDAGFYGGMNLILLGLDNIAARQWMNSTVCALYHEEVCKHEMKVAPYNDPDYPPPTPILMFDAGTEAYKGSVRRIEVGTTPCVECLMYQFPATKGVPMCTLAENPRNAAHCVLYVSQKVFVDDKPFGPGLEKPDGDDEQHILWIMERAIVRQKQYKIEGNIDFQFTQGVVKNVVPAVGFSNALVGATMVSEALKVLTLYGKRSASQLQTDGSCEMGMGSTSPFVWKDDECFECSKRISAKISSSKPLSAVISTAWDALCEGQPDKKEKVPMPANVKVMIHINLQYWTIHPHDHPMCMPQAKDDSTTIQNANLTTKSGDTCEIKPNETVMAVEFSAIRRQQNEDAADGEKKKDQEKEEAFDIFGKKRVCVMVAVTD